MPNRRTLGALLAAACLFEVAARDGRGGTVRVIYLSPSDRAYRPEYEAALQTALTDLRGWFAEELGGTTFGVAADAVEWVQTSHPSSWYQTNPETGAFEAGRYWESVTADAFALTGGRFFDDENRWLLYMDADQLPGQYTGGTSSVALMPANDLRGLAGEPLVAISPGDSTENPGFDRWVGGMGHELGHAMGLPHPPGSPGGPDDWSLMYWGYLSFPNTYLTPDEEAHIRQTGFGNQAVADYNNDGQVNLADYDTWRANYGSSGLAADGNFDGAVDAADFTVWRDRFGPQSNASTPAATPEPGSIALLVCSLIPTVGRRSRTFSLLQCSCPSMPTPLRPDDASEEPS